MARNSQSKADYQPWNHEEFMADRRVRRMTCAGRKCYIMLLHEAFFCSTRPFLPDDDDELWTMADCESRDEWESVKVEVREMFLSFTQDEVRLLAQKRVEEDWDRILVKRGVVSELRRAAANARWNAKDANLCKPMQTDANDAISKEVSKASEVKQVSEETAFQDLEEQDGQEMNAVSEIKTISNRLFGSADMWESNQVKIREAAKIEGGTVVVRYFEEWALENSGVQKPISEFVRHLPGILAGTYSPAADKTTVDLAREIAYQTGMVITFDDKQKAALGKLVKDGNSDEELISFARKFVSEMDKENDYERKFATKTFLETADQVIYTARKEKLDRAKESTLTAQIKSQLEREGVETRARLAESEEEEYDPLLDG